MFTWPAALFALLLVPLLAAIYIWGLKRRYRHRLLFSSIHLVRTAANAEPSVRRHVPPALYLLAITALVIGLSRPYASIPDTEATGTVILVLDASRSMLATDIAPTRIDAAKSAIRDFARRQPPGIKIGLVAFSGSGWLLTPPTTDRRQLYGAVDYLTLGRGTNIGDGLLVALETIVSPDGPDTSYAGETLRRPLLAPVNPKESVIVLLSDGASTVGPPPLDVAQELAQVGVRVYTVGVGTAQGAPSPGFGGLRELDDVTLKGIAAATGGKYYTAQNASQLHDIYRQISTHHELVMKRTELTFLAVAAALLFSITGGVLGMLWSARLP